MSQRVYAACAEVLMLAVSFPQSPSMGSAGELRQRLQVALDEMVGKGRSLGIQEPDLADMRYAVVAFLDEQILKSNWPGRNEWMSQPLQLVLFNQYTAGEHFFNRLRGLLGEGRADAIAAYQLCLALGFRGQYGTGADPAGLAGFVNAALQHVGRTLPRSDKLGPHAIPADRAGKVKSSNAPLVAFAAVGLLIAFGLTFALERLVHADVRKALDVLPQGATLPAAAAPGR
ncbi:MAG: DotU family type IV/VI secretion system protein [Myxococcales bacterium]|nr:MAG: DotU family type IV/VI secretion system protein [Myxococcales bacterium]